MRPGLAQREQTLLLPSAELGMQLWRAGIQVCGKGRDKLTFKRWLPTGSKPHYLRSQLENEELDVQYCSACAVHQSAPNEPKCMYLKLALKISRDSTFLFACLSFLPLRQNNTNLSSCCNLLKTNCLKALNDQRKVHRRTSLFSSGSAWNSTQAVQQG